MAWLTYQRRTISADTLARVFGPIRSAAIARFWLDDLYLALYRSVLLVFSRAIGWIDRYLVDGVLNVISAWTLDAGDLPAAHADRQGPGLRVGRRPRPARADGLDRSGLVTGLPVLSIITWSPFVAALIIMAFGAPQAAAGAARRRRSARRSRWCSRSGSASPTTARRRLPVQRSVAAGAVVRHHLPPRARRHGPGAGAADRDHPVRRRVRVVDGAIRADRSSTRCCSSSSPACSASSCRSTSSSSSSSTRSRCCRCTC